MTDSTSYYKVKETPSSPSFNVFLLPAALIASGLAVSGDAQALPLSPVPRTPPYHLGLEQETYPGDGLFQDITYPSIESFVTQVSDFYADLLSKQEPLGEEFQKVLYDSLRELYGS